MNLPPQPRGSPKSAAMRMAKLRWVLLVLTMLGMAATAALGTWQLRRGAGKEALASRIAAQNKLPALTNNTLPAAATVHRTVDLRGTWLAQYTFFLDNRFMAGRAGFYVVTPLLLDDGLTAVWVQRGWVARNVQDRTRLPDVPTPPTSALVQGRVIESISRVYALGEASESAPDAARASPIRQNLPTVDFGSKVRLLPLAVLQSELASDSSASPAQAKPALEDGLLRDWPQADAGVAKHYGYAFQWFALCGLIIVLYVWFQFIAPRRRKP